MTIRKTATIVAMLLPGFRAVTGICPRGSWRCRRSPKAGRCPKPAVTHLQVTEEILPLRIPGHTLGETEGVSQNKAGHLFVYSRTGKGGSARGGTAAELYEFAPAPDYKFVKEWLPDNMAPPSPFGARRQGSECLDRRWKAPAW